MRSVFRPLVTVVVPVYKVENYLSRCVESIRNQSYPELEIILVDDGSPDACPGICDSFRSRDDRIVVIHKENGGLSSARNAGIRAAKGDYLSFVDSDDFIQTDMIEQLVTAAARFGTPASVCGFTSDESRLKKGITQDIRTFSAAEAIRELLLDGAICTSAWAKLFEKRLFDDIVFPEGKLYEDYGTVYKLFHKAGRIAFADSEKYYYTYNGAGITKSAFSSAQMDFFTVSDELESFVSDNYPALRELARYRATDMAVSLYKKLSLTPEAERFSDERDRLVRIIRRDAIGFLSSRYPAGKKLSGLTISLFPGLTQKLFAVLFAG